MKKLSIKNFLAHICAIITIFVWGTTFVSTKILLNDFLAVEILFLRFLLGFIVLFIICPKILKFENFKKESLFILAGFFGIMLYYLLENIALQYTLATNVGVIMSSAPFFVGILSYFNLKNNKKENLSLLFFIGFITALLGIYLISFKNTMIEFNPLGDFLALCASFVWAIYSILIKKIASFKYPTLQATTKIFLYGIILMIPVLLFFEYGFLNEYGFLEVLNSTFNKITKPINFLNLLYLGFGASALCFIFWNHCLKILGAVKTSVYIYLVPVICAVASVLILKEQLNIYSIFGIILVIFGLVLSNFKKNK